MNFKSKEMGSLRIFLLLLRKSWQVRRIHWVVSLIEIVIPVSFMCFSWLSFDGILSDSFDVQNETHYESRSLEQLIDQIDSHNRSMIITYTPSNPFIDKLMNKVDDCLKNIAGFRGFDSKSELVIHASNFNSKLVVPIIFDESVDESTKHLHYVILKKPSLDQYNMFWIINLTDYYTNELFVQSQICLDRSFIEVKSNETRTNIPRVYIQRYPYPSYTRPKEDKSLGLLNHSILILLCVFTIPQIIEASKVSGEKNAGMNILMSINGISNSLNLFSWILSGSIFLSIICVVYVGLLYFTYALHSGNPIILFTFLVVHFAHAITFTIHLSAHISKTFRLAYILIVLNLLLYLRAYSFLESLNPHISLFVRMIFPPLLFIRAVRETEIFELMGLGIQWSNFFDSAHPFTDFQNTLGMTVILSVIGTLVHFWLAIYVNTIKPGKFGTKRHPLFFLMRKNKDRGGNLSRLSLDEEDGKYFESTSTSFQTPWIRIRNLNVVYDACFFYKEKVHALRDISIDFYKGQITSILGHNGAGKSTLMSILSGLMKPTDGLILVGSKNLEDETFEVLRDVGFYAQSDICFPSLTVKEQLQFFAMVKKGGESMLPIKSNVSSLIRKLKLFDVKDFLPTKLTEDQKRKLCLGIAFAADPSTLILDEPTSRLDYENKRIVWDILLEMKGRKTILISTHDMEEADILGDRIAIMHQGRFKSYGTSLYLKKTIAGQRNIGVTLSVERWCDPDRIRHEIHNDAQIIEKQDKRIIVDTPISPTLLGSLENLKKNKKELGVIGIELSHVGLGQVFLKVAEDSDRPQKRDEVIIRNKVKRQGIGNQLQSFKALLANNFQYTLMNVATLGTQVFAVILGLIFLSNEHRKFFFFWEGILMHTTETLDMQPNVYDNPYTMHTSFDENIGSQYRLLSQSFGARSIQTQEISLALLQSAKEDPIHYSNNLVAAAEFNKSVNGSLTVNAFYSETSTFSLPISINLVSNLIVQRVLGDDFSISTSCRANLERHILVFELSWLRFQGFSTLETGIAFVIPIYYAIATFAVRPSIESANGFKHLQKMTGVSGSTYWTAMFFSDLAHYLFLVVPLVIVSVFIDQTFHLSFYGVSEIGIMILLLMLLAVNVLPIIYIFSLIKTKNNFVLKSFIFMPIGLVALEFATNYQFARYHLNYDDAASVIRVVYLALPHISFLRAQTQFLKAGMLNAICKSLPDDWFQTRCKYGLRFCCQKHCRDRSCLELIQYFSDDHIDSLKVCVIWLCVMPIIYFTILALLESKITQKIMAKFPTQRVRKPCSNEQLQLEKLIIHDKIRTLREKPIKRNIGNEVEAPPSKELFLAYELDKYYGKVRAVEDVSLRINKGECFGLFGANRSGKSTILRILAGNEIPDHGIMFFEAMHFENNERDFLAQMGYCSQHDPTLKCLNSYDHLRLFARLRGVPEDRVEEEVRAWIGRLNLTAYASQPSGTLSSGNKQRLNLAMALVGSPKFVLMDEPTTFMDPGARRSFWRTIKSCKSAGQTFLLASHNMDECEILCERTAIILDGKLLCLGTPDEMKKRFGSGYDVQIRISSRHNKSQVDRIKKDMRVLLQCVLTDENIGYLMYYVVGAGTTWSKIYGVMNKIQSKYDCVDDFLVIVRLNDQSV